MVNADFLIVLFYNLYWDKKKLNMILCIILGKFIFIMKLAVIILI